MLSGLFLFAGCEKIVEQRKQHYYEEGKRFYEAGDYANAIVSFNNAIVFDSEYFDAYYLRGLSYLKQKRYKNASDSLLKVVEGRPDDIELNILVGKTMLKAADAGRPFFYGNAKGRFDLILEMDPDNTDALVLRVKTLLKIRAMDTLEDAELEIERLRQIGVQDPRLDICAAELAILKDTLDLAREMLIRSYYEGDDWVATMLFLAERYEAGGNIKGYIDIYKTVIARVKDKEPYQRNLASYLRKYRMQEEEESLYRWMLTGQEEDGPAVKVDMINFYIAYDRFDEAEKLLVSGLETYPENPQLKMLLIEVYQKKGAIEQAIQVAEHMLKSIDPESKAFVGMTTVLAGLYVDNGDLEKATRRIEEVLEKEPENDKALFVKCRIDIKKGRNIRAIADLRKLSLLHKENPEYAYWLGVMHKKQDEVVMAERAFREALETMPAHKDALLALGEIYLSKGYMAELRLLVAAYLAIKPDDQEVRELVMKIDTPPL